MNPDEAERRFAELLAEAGLPPFVSSSAEDPRTEVSSPAW
jgi:hypothetical protein